MCLNTDNVIHFQHNSKLLKISSNTTPDITGKLKIHDHQLSVKTKKLSHACRRMHCIGELTWYNDFTKHAEQRPPRSSKNFQAVIYRLNVDRPFYRVYVDSITVIITASLSRRKVTCTVVISKSSRPFERT